MADAKITISLTPHEFDLVRDAVDNTISNQNSIINDRSYPAPDRDAARRTLLGLTDILKKLR